MQKSTIMKYYPLHPLDLVLHVYGINARTTNIQVAIVIELFTNFLPHISWHILLYYIYPVLQPSVGMWVDVWGSSKYLSVPLDMLGLIFIFKFKVATALEKLKLHLVIVFHLCILADRTVTQTVSIWSGSQVHPLSLIWGSRRNHVIIGLVTLQLNRLHWHQVARKSKRKTFRIY